MILPPELDLATYAEHNPDLQAFSQEQLRQHWHEFGQHEGRIASKVTDRNAFLGLLILKSKLLEIGVFDNPTLEFLRNETRIIHYADWLSKEGLISRATLLPNRIPERVPDIQWILAQGYDQITTKYDAVVSHHCVEHQPDLIRHFINIHSILEPGGCYFFTIPDKRRCFDHFINVSTIVDVLEAYYLEKTSPSFKSVLEHRCFIDHTYPLGSNPYQVKDPNVKEKFARALLEYKTTPYVDVHCWQFTPFSFKELYDQLTSLQFLPPYSELRVYQGANEFYVALVF